MTYMQALYITLIYEKEFTLSLEFSNFTMFNITQKMIEKGKELLEIHKKLSIPYLQLHMKISNDCAQILFKLINNELHDKNN